MNKKTDIDTHLKMILDMSIAITREKDYNRLLEGIVHTAMEVSRCDGGTLYLYRDNALKFKIMRTISMDFFRGGDGEEIDLPDVAMDKTNVCAYCAINRNTVNIEDVYESELFDFTGPRRYDAMTGYHTQSMLVLPIISHEDELLGVLQLINAMDDYGNVVPFDYTLEYLILSLSSQAAVSLSNMVHMEEMRRLLDSAIAAFTTAIDERTPYNANHTANVAKYCDRFSGWLKSHGRGVDKGISLTAHDRDQLIMAARLHDVGKLIVPLEVMNKSARLSESGMKEVEDRFAYINLINELEKARGEKSPEEYQNRRNILEDSLLKIKDADTAGFLPDEKLQAIKDIAAMTYKDLDGDIKPVITEDEAGLLSIRKGTLSADERSIMESHVTMTARILDKIHFGEAFKEVAMIASMHHEFLDGSGYPGHVKADQIPTSVRIITICDIFDSLRAADRPYKKSMPLDRAIFVLRDMVKEGKLDHDLVELFAEFAENTPGM